MRRYRIAIPVSVAILIVALLVAAQIALPSIAAQHIRDQLEKSGKVISVKVSAFPAIELLWHDADTVTVRMASYHSGTSHLTGLLDQSSGVGTMHASAQVLTDGLLTLHDAQLRKHENTLTGTAQVDLSDLEHAFPELKSVTPIGSSNGQLMFDAAVSLSVFSGTVPFTAQVQNGAIVVAPDIPLLSSVFRFNVFSDPHVAVDRLGATKTAGGLSVSASGQLH
jgi:hypothetical protein